MMVTSDFYRDRKGAAVSGALQPAAVRLSPSLSPQEGAE